MKDTVENIIRLSFIVPMYNVEQYVEECIHSLYAQDIPENEYEVIVIDDCSTDNSYTIVEKLKSRYSTITLLQMPENSRQGTARNKGLSIAKGKYIWFVDSDDYIKTNVLAGLLDEMDELNLDIIDFDFDYVGTKHFKKIYPPYSLGVCSGVDYVFDKHKRWSLKCGTVTNAIISLKFIQKNKLHFAEKVQYEDSDYSLAMYSKALRVVHKSIAPYCYRLENGSTVHSKPSIQKIDYHLKLALRYVKLYYQLKSDVRWKKALKELVNYVIDESFLILKQLSSNDKDLFYCNTNKNITKLRCFIGIKKYLALKSKFIFTLLYSKNRKRCCRK